MHDITDTDKAIKLNKHCLVGTMQLMCYNRKSVPSIITTYNYLATP